MNKYIKCKKKYLNLKDFSQHGGNNYLGKGISKCVIYKGDNPLIQISDTESITLLEYKDLFLKKKNKNKFLSTAYNLGFWFAFDARNNNNFHLVVSYDNENIPVMMMAVLYCNVSLTPQDIEQSGVDKPDKIKLSTKLSDKTNIQYHIGIHRTFYDIEKNPEIRKGDALTFFKGGILCIRQMYKMNPTYLCVHPIDVMEDKLIKLIDTSKLKNFYDDLDLSLIIDKYKKEECILQQNEENIMDLSASQFTNEATCIINLNPKLNSTILEKLKKINCGWCKGVNTAGKGFLLKTREFLLI